MNTHTVKVHPQVNTKSPEVSIINNNCFLHVNPTWHGQKWSDLIKAEQEYQQLIPVFKDGSIVYI